LPDRDGLWRCGNLLRFHKNPYVSARARLN
jgi:hypothetical protein